MTRPMFWRWLKLGTICELIVAYPITKLLIWAGPQISEWSFGL